MRKKLTWECFTLYYRKWPEEDVILNREEFNVVKTKF